MLFRSDSGTFRNCSFFNTYDTAAIRGDFATATANLVFDGCTFDTEVTPAQIINPTRCFTFANLTNSHFVLSNCRFITSHTTNSMEFAIQSEGGSTNTTVDVIGCSLSSTNGVPHISGSDGVSFRIYGGSMILVGTNGVAGPASLIIH